MKYSLYTVFRIMRSCRESAHIDFHFFTFARSFVRFFFFFLKFVLTGNVFGVYYISEFPVHPASLL